MLAVCKCKGNHFTSLRGVFRKASGPYAGAPVPGTEPGCMRLAGCIALEVRAQHRAITFIEHIIPEPITARRLGYCQIVALQSTDILHRALGRCRWRGKQGRIRQRGADIHQNTRDPAFPASVGVDDLPPKAATRVLIIPGERQLHAHAEAG